MMYKVTNCIQEWELTPVIPAAPRGVEIRIMVQSMFKTAWTKKYMRLPCQPIKACVVVSTCHSHYLGSTNRRITI
jgi:hypothetical protein